MERLSIGTEAILSNILDELIAIKDILQLQSEQIQTSKTIREEELAAYMKLLEPITNMFGQKKQT